jgi:uncharacterized integral membrane protein
MAQFSKCGRLLLVFARGPGRYQRVRTPGRARQLQVLTGSGIAMRYVIGFVVGVLVLAILVFAVQNLEAVDVLFLAWSVHVPKVVVILGSYVLGMVTGWGLVEVIKMAFRK